MNDHLHRALAQANVTDSLHEAAVRRRVADTGSRRSPLAALRGIRRRPADNLPVQPATAEAAR